ncbi:O-antigen ligase [Cryobacterium sp. Y50]|uniref:O-antigen ligase family protein n=1 Tax=Cryobacterium sp. Y50 TaxID=2048286 RepID=UPI001304AF38|nr:O-antigen ligase family protein [Cryobacterium sp. Y50]
MLAWLPVDLTLVAALVVLASAIVSALTTRLPFPHLLPPLVLLVVFTFGLIAASFDAYSAAKVAVMFSVTLFGLILAPVLVLTEKRRQFRFIIALLVVGFTASLYTLVFPETASAESNRLVFEGTNTIGTARIAGAALLICIVLVLARARRPQPTMGFLALAAPLMVVLVMTGSRGPQLALALALGLAIIASPQLRRHLRNLLPLALLGLAVIAAALSRGSDGLQKTIAFVAGGEDNSTLTRVSLWSESLTAIPQLPWGHGWGDFNALAQLTTSELSEDMFYPHNLILEIFVEGGWLTGIVVVALVAATLLKGALSAVDPVRAIIFGLAVFSLTNAMVSGDINDNRLLWVTLAIIWTFPPVNGRFPAARRPTHFTRWGSGPRHWLRPGRELREGQALADHMAPHGIEISRTSKAAEQA